MNGSTLGRDTAFQDEASLICRLRGLYCRRVFASVALRYHQYVCRDLRDGWVGE